MTLMNMTHLQAETVHGLDEISVPVDTKGGDQGIGDNINKEGSNSLRMMILRWRPFSVQHLVEIDTTTGHLSMKNHSGGTHQATLTAIGGTGGISTRTMMSQQTLTIQSQI